MNLTELFALSLVGRANRDALEYEGRSLTFGEIDARADRMAGELAARGLSKGDRLAVHLPNRVEFIDLYLACVRLGVIFVPMNILYKERELRHIATDAEPKALVASVRNGATYPESAVVWDVDELARAASGREQTPTVTPLDGDDPAMIVYTSGTTGVAKGAVLSHNNLAANGITLTAVWRITESDRYLAMLPLFHVHGLGNGLHSWLISGCRMRLLERFDQRTTPAVMLDFKPTLIFGVPTVYIRMIDGAVLSDEDARTIGTAARLFVSGSAPLPAHVHEAFRQRFGHTILERYGMSEALMIMRASDAPVPSARRFPASRHGSSATMVRCWATTKSAKCRFPPRISSPDIGAGPTRPPTRSTTVGSRPATSACARPMATTRCAAAAVISSSAAASISTPAKSKSCFSRIHSSARQPSSA